MKLFTSALSGGNLHAIHRGIGVGGESLSGHGVGIHTYVGGNGSNHWWNLRPYIQKVYNFLRLICV